MSIRRIRYANQLGISNFDLADSKEFMMETGVIAQAILGTATQLDGFACTASSTPDLNVHIGGGTIFDYIDVDATPFGALPTQLPADTADQILKEAYQLNSTPTTIAIGTVIGAGNSRNDLIQISLQEVDGNVQSIPFFNGFNGQVLNPATTQNLNSQRICSVVISKKIGTEAPTGTQVTPPPDSGYVGASVVTMAYGQTAVSNSQIALYPSAPFIEKLPSKISEATADLRYAQITAVQAGGLIYGTMAGSANTYTASVSPAITSLTVGMEVNLLVNVSNTSTSTLNLNSQGVKNITLPGGIALLPGELQAGQTAKLLWDGTQWILTNRYPLAIFSSASANQTISVGTSPINSFTGENDPFGFWNNTSKEFVMVRAGYYNTSGIVNTSNTLSSPFTLYINLLINGSSIETIFKQNSTDGDYWVGSFFYDNIFLNVNDTISFSATAAVNNVLLVGNFYLKYNGY